jgi:hypothetical protein
MMVTESDHGRSSAGRPRASQAIVFSGLAVGVLDGLAASINASLIGTSPVRVWQYVASGLLGPSSFNGGNSTALLGVFLHFCVAFIAATVYYFASLRFPVLIRRAVICGILYGVAVYFFMGRVVVSLSAARRFPFSLSGLLTGLFIHIICVGLPIALITSRAAKEK